MSAVRLLLIRILLVNCILFKLYHVEAQSFYERCGNEDVVCVGVQMGVTAVNRGGCIDKKDCYVFVSVYNTTKTIGDPPSKQYNYYWDLAILTSDPSGEFRYNKLYLIVSKQKVELRSGRNSPLLMPYWFYGHYKENITDLVELDRFEPKIKFCKSGANQCAAGDIQYNVFNTGERDDYIKFGSLEKISYDVGTGNLTYLTASGTSGQVLSLKHQDVEYKYDLINDKLTIAIFHWNGPQGTELKLLQPDHGGNFEPKHLFRGAKSGTREPVDQEQEKKKKMLWLWIVIGVVGASLLIGLCIMIYCCCCNDKKNKRKSRSREGNNEPVPMSEAGTKTVGNTTLGKQSSVNSIGKRSPKKASSKRLDYIAQLAGYTPGKPVTKKETSVKEHDFNKSFHSDSVVVKRI